MIFEHIIIGHRISANVIPNIERGYHDNLRVDDSIETRRLKRSSLINFMVTKKTISEIMSV